MIVGTDEEVCVGAGVNAGVEEEDGDRVGAVVADGMG